MAQDFAPLRDQVQTGGGPVKGEVENVIRMRR